MPGTMESRRWTVSPPTFRAARPVGATTWTFLVDSPRNLRTRVDLPVPALPVRKTLRPSRIARRADENSSVISMPVAADSGGVVVVLMDSSVGGLGEARCGSVLPVVPDLVPSVLGHLAGDLRGSVARPDGDGPVGGDHPRPRGEPPGGACPENSPERRPR